MSGVEGARQLISKINRFSRDLDAVAERVAKESRKEVEKAVQADIGDSSMSGWRRGKPIQIYGAYEVLSPSTAEVTPSRASKGPMRVLESGRNQDGRPGERRSRKTGKLLKQKRYNGQTRGKGTWSDAEKLIVRELPKRAHKSLHHSMSIFGKG